MAVAPPAQVVQFLNFDMLVLLIIFDRQTIRVEDSDVTSQAVEDARSFIGQ